MGNSGDVEEKDVTMPWQSLPRFSNSVGSVSTTEKEYEVAVFMHGVISLIVIVGVDVAYTVLKF